MALSLRRHLQGVIDRVRGAADVLVTLNRAAQTPSELVELRRRLLAFRRQFLRAETTLDYFADAIATRTNAGPAALLRACDSLAYRSMAQILDQIGKPTPVVLTYLDKGLGASILKAGLRLWDAGDLSPVAAVKITRHNLLRPTAVIHEAGHQVAHIAGWNQELAAALSQGLAETSSELAGMLGGMGVGDRGRRRRLRPHRLRQRRRAARRARRRDLDRCSVTRPVIRTRSATCACCSASRCAATSTAPGPGTTLPDRGRCCTRRGSAPPRRGACSTSRCRR